MGKRFLDFQPALEKAKAVVLPVPYEGTATYGKGTGSGPSAILEASTQVEFYDIELGKNICEHVPAHTLDALRVSEDPEKTAKLVEEAVGSIVKQGKMPVVLGGEHSITPGAVAGLGEKDISVLQIDAHSDLRDSYEGKRYSHACAMRRVRDITKSTVQVGIRSMCDEEAGYIKENRLEESIFYADDLLRNKKNGMLDRKDIEKMVSQLKDKVYVTVDMDGFDPSVVPGTGTPEPGGLLWHDVLDIMRALSKRDVLGFDIVEVAPMPNTHVSEFTAAKLAYKMMGYFWSK